MPVISLEQLKEKFENPEVRSVEDLLLWIERNVAARSADYDAVMNEAHQKIVDSYPALGHQQNMFAGKVLGTYAGFDRTALKQKFFKDDDVTPLDDADVDA